MSGNWFVSPGTRLSASDVNATYRPFALIAGLKLNPFACDPSVATETRTTLGTQPEGAPRQVSRRNTSVKLFVSLGTRVEASEEKATKRPSPLIETTSLPTSPSVRLSAMLDLSITPEAPGGTGLMMKLKLLEVPPPGDALNAPT